MKKLILITLSILSIQGFSQIPYTSNKTLVYIRTDASDNTKPLLTDFTASVVCYNAYDSVVWVKENGVVIPKYTCYPYTSGKKVLIIGVETTTNKKYSTLKKMRYVVTNAVSGNLPTLSDFPTSIYRCYNSEDSILYEKRNGVVIPSYIVYAYNTYKSEETTPEIPELATRIYVSPTGSDASTNWHNPLTPFFTLTKAWSKVQAGDTIMMRGGTYAYNSRQNLTGKSGTAANKIVVMSYPGEQAIITKSASYIGGSWPNGLVQVTANYTYWKQLEFTGFNVLSGHVFTLWNGSYNTFELINSHHNEHGMLIDGNCTGNLVLNSDFHHNYDPLATDAYGGADGIEIGDITAGSANTVIGCRFWSNSDDGIDCYRNDGFLLIENCWAWSNGYREDGVTLGGNGDGFKLGNTLYDYPYTHLRTVTNCLAFHNKNAGFATNGMKCVGWIYNNTGYHNADGAGVYALNFQFAETVTTRPHILRNNIAYANQNPSNLQANYTNCVQDHNTWNGGVTVTDADFLSVSMTGVDGVRQSDGSLPVLNFLKLASGSDLINKGVDVGLPYLGLPDLGAYEFSTILTIEGTTTNDATSGSWSGVTFDRSVPTTFTYKNNSLTSINSSGYMLLAGDENTSANDNNLNGQIITGNKVTWNGTDNASITHALFVGYNVNSQIKYNYLDKTPYGIVCKSNGMTDVSGVISYNIFKNPSKCGIIVKGINGIKIYNNTFYSERTFAHTTMGLIQVYSNNSPVAASTGTKIKNNIFYTVNQTVNIYIEDIASATGFESDYNIFYCEAGTPLFNYLGTLKTFAQWQALGYDLHSVVINPNFTDTNDFIPTARLNYGINLGSTWQTGLSKTATWVVNSSPTMTNQNGTWQVGARVY